MLTGHTSPIGPISLEEQETEKVKIYAMLITQTHMASEFTRHLPCIVVTESDKYSLSCSVNFKEAPLMCHANEARNQLPASL